MYATVAPEFVYKLVVGDQANVLKLSAPVVIFRVSILFTQVWKVSTILTTKVGGLVTATFICVLPLSHPVLPVTETNREFVVPEI